MFRQGCVEIRCFHPSFASAHMPIANTVHQKRRYRCSDEDECAGDHPRGRATGVTRHVSERYMAYNRLKGLNVQDIGARARTSPGKIGKLAFMHSSL
jgi:hypothetical protein